MGDESTPEWTVPGELQQTRPLPPTLLATTAAGAAMLAALAAAFYFFHLAASGGSAAALHGALMLSMAVVRHPLVHLEHNRRVAQEQRRMA